MKRKSPFAAHLADALDDDFSFLASEKEALQEVETDICACGAIRRLHEKGVEGSVVDSKKCKGFRWED